MIWTCPCRTSAIATFSGSDAHLARTSRCHVVVTRGLWQWALPGPDLRIEGAEETGQSMREPRTDAYQEHGMYKQLVEELADEMHTL